MAVHGIIVAAGSGTRFGGEVPKQLVTLRERPVLAWSILAFAGAGIQSLTVVAAAPHRSAIAQLVESVAPSAATVVGGATRSESVRLGLASLAASEDDAVLIHDAARPLVTETLITAVVAAVRGNDAATPAVPASDTLVEVSEGLLGRPIDRTTVNRIQTPQGFRLGTIMEAHRLAARAGDSDATDDAGLVQRYLDIDVAVVPGESDNLKITASSDLAIAEALLDRRLGQA